jgi:HK97 family phage prohead protease
MEKIFNLTSTFKALDESDDGIHICGMASTADFDRAGDTIDHEAWTKGGLDNFEKNPIILFNHNYDKPIGRATGLKVTPNGLELKAKISKSAPDHVAQLVKEGILGAFSVGFRVKDADYLTETDGLKIKDAELFEVSVVSVPCNQAATFSLAKSFDSMDEYEEFKKTFKTNSVDLAGQSLAKDEDSFEASETPDETVNTVQKEINMSEVNTPEIDLDAFAKRVAEETAAKIAMKQAEEKAAVEAEAKAAQEAEAVKTAQDEEVKQTIRTGIESGAERLMADMNAKLAEKDAEFGKIVNEFKTQLEEKNEELTKIRESKRVFTDRDGSSKDALTKFGKDFMYGHLYGVITGKGWDTDYSRSIFEKAGMSYPAGDPSLATEVSRQIEKEIQLELRTAPLFREMAVNSKTTVIPLQSDTSLASWGTTAGSISASSDNGGTNVINRDGTGGSTFEARQKVLTVERLLSTTYLDNYIDEEVLINLMPMMAENIARSHARAVDTMIVSGISGQSALPGLQGLASAFTTAGLDAAYSATNARKVVAKDLVNMRKEMGVYGLNPQDVVYIVSQDVYHDLINDAEFDNVFEVGSDTALKLTGQVGAVYGSPVVISDNFPAVTPTNGQNVGVFAVNTRNFVIPRLRGVNIEQDYQVTEQRRVLVGTQHMGFDELFDNVSGKSAAVRLNFG